MPLPQTAHPDDVGLDLHAMAVECMRPGLYVFDTGISVQAPLGFYCEVVPRSSIVKTDFMMANSIGVIDPGYRGRIKVMLRYLGPDADGGQAQAESLVGARIAQIVVRRREPLTIEAVEELSETQRGKGGFGSTGR